MALSWHSPNGSHDLTQGMSLYRHSCLVDLCGRMDWQLGSGERPDWGAAGNTRSLAESRLVAHQGRAGQNRIPRAVGLHRVPLLKGGNTKRHAHGPGRRAGCRRGASSQA